MPNEQQQQPNPQVDNQDSGFTEPQDLSQAFETLREAEQKPAETSVEQPVEPSAEPVQSGGQPQQEQPYYDYQEGTTPALYNDAGTESYGYPDSSQSFDYGSFAKGMVEEITRAAAEQATDYFKEQGIEKFNVNMLYQRDENTGEVTFQNPDSPNRPFASRQEAQAWCDAINNDIDNEWRRTAVEKRDEILQQALPAMRLLEFAPKFNAMSKAEQDVFDMLIEPYAVQNEFGQTIGYNCDLDSFAGQASKIANKYGAKIQEMQQQYQQQPAQPTGPAVDMRSSSSQGQPTHEITEPKDLSEAMKMLKG